MSSTLRIFFRNLFRVVVTVYAIAGFVLTSGFLAVKFGWSDTEGTVDASTETFNDTAVKVANLSSIPTPDVVVLEDKQNPVEQRELCKVTVIAKVSSRTAHTIASTYTVQESLPLLINMTQAAVFRMPPEHQSALTACETTATPIKAENIVTDTSPDGPSIFAWQNSEQWKVIEQAVLKDATKIASASATAGVKERTVLSVCLVEQLRLYFTQRELFEKVFEPLTILSTATKNAWGVMAIKEETAIATEQHLQDASSPYYLGSEKSNLLPYSTADVASERYNRLTNSRDHSYSYLYGSLFIAQLEAQWKQAGHPIDQRPEISATLFNLGFKKSKPKPDPQVGGSTLTIADTQYSFGGLAYEIYYSGILQDTFGFED
ncbi:hypothetical protein BH11PAT4_BH11PAT4_1360 [soil metagenome]